ncbi:MAG: hypothetical protein P1U42_06105 [Phycisphaerales bacterium]|nr:hypothetical protein [Phycisphaerales bacterium]
MNDGIGSVNPDRLPRHPTPELLREYLDTHDAPCPICGYNLRGVVLVNCPECDAPIELTVGSSQLQLGAWLTAILAFAMALGFDLIIGMLLVIPVVITGGEDDAVLFLAGSLTALGLGCIGMLWVLIANRSAWMKKARRTQWKIAWTIFMSVFLIHLLVGVGFVLIAI